jgi:hypothetical protein
LRATLEPMKSGEFAFSYDHPSPAMLALYKRMGGSDVSARRRWVRLLAASEQIHRRWGQGIAARVAGKAGDLALRWRDRMRRGRFDVDVTPLAPGEDAALDELDARLGPETRFRLSRSAAHVHWRYLENALAPHEVLCAKRRGTLVGYLVFRPRGRGVLAIVDLVGAGLDALISALVELGHERGASAVWCSVLRGSPVESAFARNGFVARDEAPGVVLYAPTAVQATQHALQNPHNWWMLEGDEDV